MKRITKLDWFFGLSAAWDLFWATFNLAHGHIGYVIFYGVLAATQVVAWVYVRNSRRKVEK